MRGASPVALGIKRAGILKIERSRRKRGEQKKSTGMKRPGVRAAAHYSYRATGEPMRCVISPIRVPPRWAKDVTAQICQGAPQSKAPNSRVERGESG